MKRNDIPALLADWRRGRWFEREAALAWQSGRVFVIPARRDDDVYLVRFWLTAPKPLDRDGDSAGCRFESGESLLLHYFARADDDQALHDHPWDFRTTILSGGYVEHQPPRDWQRGTIDDGPGPAWDQNKNQRSEGETLGRIATDLHCVGSISYDTWTLVRTGPRVRSWGFHPPGQPWVGYREFLKLDPAVTP